MGAPARFDMQADGANSLAVDTGGFAIRNENNFGRALDEIQHDAGTYYVVGYTPVKETFDGKYRAISVKVVAPRREGPRPAGLSGARAGSAVATVSGRPAAVSPKPAADVPTKLRSEGGLVDGRSSVRSTVTRTPSLPETASARMRRRRDAVDSTGKSASRLRASIARSASAALEPARGFGATSSPRTLGETRSAEAERGWAAYEKGDVETAARHLGEAAKAPDARPWVVYALGLSHFALRRYAGRRAGLGARAARRPGVRADLLQPRGCLRPPARGQARR